jgi:hypothetical protein
MILSVSYFPWVVAAYIGSDEVAACFWPMYRGRVCCVDAVCQAEASAPRTIASVIGMLALIGKSVRIMSKAGLN